MVSVATSLLSHAASCGPLAQVDLTPQRMVWPGVVVIVLVALFVTAAVAGPLIRANSDDPADSMPIPPHHDSVDE